MHSKNIKCSLLKCGIEEYAKQTHRLHPVLEQFIRDLFSNFEMNQNKKQIVITPNVELSILEYRGIISLNFLDPKNNHEDRKPKKIGKEIPLPEEKIIRVLEKIPHNIRIQVPFDIEGFISSLQKVRIFILPWKCLPSGRATSAKFSVNGKPFSFRWITPTPCFMFLNYMIWGSGNLNAKGKHCGNCFDLATPEGMALFLHELYHIYQFYRNPFELFKSYFQAVKDSLRNAGILFSHRHIRFELESITFEYELYHILCNKPWQSKLKRFESYR